MSRNHHRFYGLERLASEHGLDIRSTMLRVATDLFCQTDAHHPSEIARYTELALALLETADTATRGVVAQKLATAPHAPEKLLRRLIDDPDAQVSGAVLSHSNKIDLDNVTDFLSECSPAEAAAIARRGDIDAGTVRGIAAHPHLLVVEALLENHRIHFDSAALGTLMGRVLEHPALAKPLFAHPHIRPADLAPLYLHAPAAIRAHIRAGTEERTPRAAPGIQIEALSELNDAVIAADRARIGTALARALQLDPGSMDRVLDDPTGEVFALALLAAGIKRAPAVRLLLIAAIDEVRMSVERIFAATDVYEETSRRAAREIVTAVVGERRIANPIYEPHMHPSGTPQRSSAARRALGHVQPARQDRTVKN